jgi:hypothetical protein
VRSGNLNSCIPSVDVVTRWRCAGSSKATRKDPPIRTVLWGWVDTGTGVDIKKKGNISKLRFLVRLARSLVITLTELPCLTWRLWRHFLQELPRRINSFLPRLLMHVQIRKVKLHTWRYFIPRNDWCCASVSLVTVYIRRPQDQQRNQVLRCNGSLAPQTFLV